jgi:phenylacetate-coenzyme A ligase PaaK-like adenylate-forming protein
MPLSILDIADIGLGLAKVYRSENWNAGRIREYQERLLVEQLRYAVTHIPYYRDLGITAGQIVDMDSLHLFPTLDKSVIQQEGDRLCNQALLARGALSSQTSGSSGQPTVTWFDRRCWNFCKYALKIRRTLLAGPPWRQRQLLLDESSNPDGSVGEPMQRSFGPFRQVRMSVFTPVQEQLETLQTLDPTVIYGTPSGVKELCDHASSQQVRPQSVDVVFLSSELISDSVRPAARNSRTSPTSAKKATITAISRARS